MKKKNILFLLVVAILLAACASQSPDFAVSASEAYYGEAGGADYYDDAEYNYALEEESFARTVESDAVFVSDGAAFDESLANQQAIERLVIKNANMSIAVTEPLITMEDVMGMAEDMGGFVVSSNLYYYTLESGVEVPQANISIRIPAERFNEAITTIENGAGQVLSKNITGQDVTQEYTDLNSRLTNLLDTQAQLQEIMDDARSTEDVLNVYNQLTYINEQIEVIKGRMQYFEQAAAMSFIELTIRSDEAVQPLTIGGWEPAGVAKDAVQALINTLKGIADFFIWVVLWLLPVLVVLYLPFRLLKSIFVKWNTRRKEKAMTKKAAKAVKTE